MHKEKISKAKSVIATRFAIKDHDSPLLNDHQNDGKPKLVNDKKDDFKP